MELSGTSMLRRRRRRAPYIQHSKRSVAELAASSGVSETTIRRRRGWSTVVDRPHTPKTMDNQPDGDRRVARPCPADIASSTARRHRRGGAAMRNPGLSRSAIHRRLQRPTASAHARNRQAKNRRLRDRRYWLHPHRPEGPPRPAARRKSHAFVAIDRATRYVYVEIHSRRGWRDGSGLPQALPGPLPAPGRSPHPDRQWRRVHPPLRR